MFIIPLILFLIAPHFVYAEQPASKEISVYNSDFSSGIKGWSVFGREKNAITFTAENNEAHVLYTGKRDWAVSNSARIPVSAGQVFEISCSGKSDLSIPSGCLCVVCMKNNYVTEYHFAQTESFTSKWKRYSTVFYIYEGIDTIYLRLYGEGKTNAYAKDISLVQLPNTTITPSTIRNEQIFENGKFSSKKVLDLYPSAEWSDNLQSQGEEKLDRGLSLTPVSQTSVMISWRLLKSDPADITFTISRTRYGTTRIITKKPISDATNFIYNDAAIGDIYTVSSNYDRSLVTYKTTNTYKSIPLTNMNGTVKIAVADLNGDGKYDFVAKCPGDNIDPGYYTPSTKTYSLQAYTSEGVLLWKKDLGWNIESGTWYSPYIAADLNSDGKAEIIVKTGDDTVNGEKDWRDKDGRVRTGPEYLSVLDGMTGKELARTDWISREGFEDYNRTSRNQLAIAYFDAPDEKTGSRKIPCIIMLRGTYGLMKAEALVYIPSDKTDSQSSQSLSSPNNSQLVPVWSYSNKFLPANTRGQGAHYTVCTDIDNDGRDEVILGSLVLDDDGSILWTTGRGHPDGVYFGDINPAHDGNEIAYFYETRQNSGGILLVDALTGKELWGLPYKTDHIHSRAMCADIDAAYPGRELYGQDCINHVYNGQRWLLASDSTVLKDAAQLDKEHNNWGFAPAVAYWNGTNQKSIVDNKLLSYTGTIVMIADITGDWREEIVTATKTDLRIYTTTIPVSIRRSCLMQDPEYRSTVTMDSNAYLQYPDTIEPVLSK